MHARISTVQFQPGAAEEAISIYRDIMLPAASKVPGFMHALMYQSSTNPEEYIAISQWASEADMLASGPPEDIRPHLKRLEQLTKSVSQDTYAILFQIDSTPDAEIPS